MFKKLIVPVGLLIVGLFVYGKILVVKKLDFMIQKIKFNFTFTQQILEITIGFINKTNSNLLVQDLNGKFYFIDNNNKEYFIGNLNSNNINILANTTTYKTFDVNLRVLSVFNNLISLITNRKGNIRFLGTANAINTNFPIDYTYKLN